MLETVLWVLVPLLILTLGWWGLSTLRRRNAADVEAGVNADAAREAAGRLNADQHRAVYRQLGAGNFLGAVQEYQRATAERSVKTCIIAVRSLERFPQVHSPRPAAGDAAQATGVGGAAAEDDAAPSFPSVPAPEFAEEVTDSATDAAPSEAIPSDAAQDLVIPAEWTESFGSAAERRTATYKFTEQVDGEAREYSTADLPPAEADQFQSMMRDGDFAGAAALFANYSGLSQEKIQPLLESAPGAHQAGPSTASRERVSDFGFEGEGPDGPVRFNSADLPEDVRTEFLEHLAAGRVDDASRIIIDFTGLPEGVVRQVLASFRGGH